MHLNGEVTIFDCNKAGKYPSQCLGIEHTVKEATPSAVKEARENVNQVFCKYEIAAMKKALNKFEEETKKLKARLALLEKQAEEGDKVHSDEDRETVNKTSVGETPPLKVSPQIDKVSAKGRTGPVGLAQVIYTTPHAIFDAARRRRYDLSNEPIPEPSQSNSEND